MIRRRGFGPPLAAGLALAVGFLTGVGPGAESYAQDDPGRELRQRLDRAAALERAGSPARALRLILDVLEEAPAEPRAVMAAERIYRSEGSLERVLPLLDRAVEADPGATLLRHAQVRVLTELGRTEALQEAGERWIASAPDREIAYREYGSALGRLGRFVEAEGVFRRGREAIGRPHALAPELADLYTQMGRWADATREWGRLVRAEPDAGWELVNVRLESLGGEAAPLVDEMIRRFGASEDMGERRLAAVAALYVGRGEEARRIAEGLLDRLPPGERQTLAARIAHIAARRAHPELVAWAYRQLVREIADDSVRHRLARQIVQHDLSAGDTASALRILDEVLDRAERGSEAQRWASARSIELQAARDPAAAERALRRYADRYGSDPEVAALALAVARSSLTAGRLDEAERVIEGVELDDRETGLAARFALLRAYLALYRGKHDAAQGQLEFAAAALTGRERGQAIRLLGIVRAGNTAELMAVAAAHRAWMRGEPLHGLDELSRRLERASESAARPAIWLWGGELALAAGTLEEGERMLRSVAERYPGSGEAPAALLALAEALARSDRRPQAIPLLEDLIVNYPESALTPVARRRLAELQEEVPSS